MKFAITGLNHRTAPVEVREKLAFDPNNLAGSLVELHGQPGVTEALILSTCNRVEIAIAAEDDADPAGCVIQFLARHRNVDPDWLRHYLYRYEEQEAIRHLFRVAASLDSMVVGEPQILGQLKAAYASAKDAGSVGGLLDAVCTRAFSVAKRVRTETDIGESAVSVSYAAVELAREIFGSLGGKKVMLVGAGKMSELAARHLKRSGAGQILVTNRTHQRAVEMAEMFEGVIIDYTAFTAALPDVDILIASSGAPHYILTRAEMSKVLHIRRNRPMFLIDIAVPRNIDPAVNELDNVFLYDIDDLQKVVEGNISGRRQEAEQAELIVDEEVARTLSRLRTREVAPTIVSLQEQLEQVRVGELSRMRGKLGGLTPEQEEAVEALTRGIINKIAHGPISELRRHAASPNGLPVIEAIRRVFRLGE